MKQFFSSKVFVKIVIGVVVLAVVYGIFLAGSPSKQRTFQFDQRRISDLQNISSAIDTYWRNNEKLPLTFDDLKNQYSYIRSVVDPVTQESYEYNVRSEIEYELCAVFAMDSSDYGAGMVRKTFLEPWTHGVGKTCFKREVQGATGRALEPALP